MRRNAKKGMEKSGKALETAKTMGYTKIITEGKKMGIHMKKYINTSRRINTKESEEWGFIVINALKKVWFATLIIELFLFIFFQPNEECSRGYYFYLFVARPSIGQGVWLAAGDILFKKFIKDKSHRTVSIFMILLVSGFAAVPVWVHTSVGLMPGHIAVPDGTVSVLQGLEDDAVAGRTLYRIVCGISGVFFTTFPISATGESVDRCNDLCRLHVCNVCVRRTGKPFLYITGRKIRQGFPDASV